MKHPIFQDLQRLSEREDKEDKEEEKISTNNVKMEIKTLDLNGLSEITQQMIL